MPDINKTKEEIDAQVAAAKALAAATEQQYEEGVLDPTGSAADSAEMAQDAENAAATYASNAAVQADRAEVAASLAQPKEVLDIAQPLRNAHVYTTQVTAVDTDLSTLQLAVTADRVTKCEIWVDYVSGSATWPSLWSWVDDIEPSAALIGSHYIVELFADGDIVVARLKLSYTVPAQQ